MRPYPWLVTRPPGVLALRPGHFQNKCTWKIKQPDRGKTKKPASKKAKPEERPAGAMKVDPPQTPKKRGNDLIDRTICLLREQQTQLVLALVGAMEIEEELTAHLKRTRMNKSGNKLRRNGATSHTSPSYWDQ